MERGITSTLGGDRPLDASARDSSVSAVDSTSDADVEPVSPRTGAGGSRGLRRSGRQRAPPDYLHYS